MPQISCLRMIAKIPAITSITARIHKIVAIEGLHSSDVEHQAHWLGSTPREPMSVSAHITTIETLVVKKFSLHSSPSRSRVDFSGSTTNRVPLLDCRRPDPIGANPLRRYLEVTAPWFRPRTFQAEAASGRQMIDPRIAPQAGCDDGRRNRRQRGRCQLERTRLRSGVAC